MNSKWCIGIVGSGKMGSGIAEYLSGFDIDIVWIVRTDAAIEEKAAWLRKKITRLIKTGLLPDMSAYSKMQMVEITKDFNSLSKVNLVIECCTEDPDIKRDVFSQVVQFAGDNTLLLSNTSSIPLRLIFRDADPERSAGMHFFYPVQIKKYVEINTLIENSSVTLNTIKDFLKFIDREALILNENEHFALNRLFLPYLAQACRCIQEYGLDIGDIDKIVEDKMFYIGPFRFMDSVGIHIMYESVRRYTDSYMSNQFFGALDEKLGQLLDIQNKLNVKTSGFHANQDKSDTKKEYRVNSLKYDERLLKAANSMKAVFVNSFYKDADNGYADRSVLIDAVSEYMGLSAEMEKTLFSCSDMSIAETLTELYRSDNCPEYEVSSVIVKQLQNNTFKIENARSIQ